MQEKSMDHRALVASLDDDERLFLTRRSDWQGLRKLAGHTAAIGLTSIWIVLGASGWQIAMLLQGIQLAFLFTLLHETAHETPFASRSLNTLVASICGFVVFLPPVWFRYYHLAHHRHTHVVGKDPELDGPPVDNWRRYLLVVSGLPIWRFHFSTLFRNAFGDPDYDYLPASVHSRVRNESRAQLAAYSAILLASVIMGSLLMIYLWIVPLLLGQPFLRLYLLAEHGRCPHVADMLKNTRTTFTNRFVRWLAWNMPYHAEHHAYPSVPFHKLPLFHEKARDHLKTTSEGYRRFHREYLAALQAVE